MSKPVPERFETAEEWLQDSIFELSKAAQMKSLCRCPVCEGEAVGSCICEEDLADAKQRVDDAAHAMVQEERDEILKISPGSARAGRLRNMVMHPDSKYPGVFRRGWYAGFDAYKRLISERK